MAAAPVLGHPVLAHLFAHQGGWDEMLLVAAPIALLALVLWMANRRANRIHEAREASEVDERPELPGS